MITGIYIGTDRLDLFEDENTTIKSSVDKIEDITKVFTDTSKNLTVPATDNNNRIFKYWYNNGIVNSFDARKKIPSSIDLGGVNFKVGKIRLNKVNFKNNQPESYSLDFFGNLVELKDLLGDDKLTDLDTTVLSDLDFEFNYVNVKNKLGIVDDVSFSLLSKRRLFYDSSDGVEDTDKQTNIYYDGSRGDTGLKPSDLTGSIKQLKVIEAIEDNYNLTFSRDFFGLYDFNNQFLALTGEDVKYVTQIPLNIEERADPTRSGDAIMVLGDLPTENANTIKITLGLGIDTEYPDLEFSLYIKNGERIISRKDNQKKYSFLEVNKTDISSNFENVTFWIETQQPVKYSADIYRWIYSPSYTYLYDSGFILSNNVFSIKERLPDIKVIDYIKGLFKFSKLIVIPEKDGTMYVDSLVNYYKKGTVHDLTDYIDYSSHTVKAGTILNEIKYNFQDPQTVLNSQFKEINGIGYGDLELSIYDDNGLLIDGDSLEYEVPFEQIVYEKIVDLNNSTYDTELQYGLLQDIDTNFVTIKPHIHYIATSIGYVKFVDGDDYDVLASVNYPTHILDKSLQTFSTTFGNEFNEFDGTLINNTIFSNYHQPYTERIFNKHKRELSVKAINVPEFIVLNLGLNDVIQIKDDYYRIDSFETNTTNNDIDFELITDRIVDITPIESLTVDNTTVTVDNTLITVDKI